MDAKREHEFISLLWKLIRKHRTLTKQAMDDGDELILKYRDIPFALGMVKAYINTLED